MNRLSDQETLSTLDCLPMEPPNWTAPLPDFWACSSLTLCKMSGIASQAPPKDASPHVTSRVNGQPGNMITSWYGDYPNICGVSTNYLLGIAKIFSWKLHGPALRDGRTFFLILAISSHILKCFCVFFLPNLFETPFFLSLEQFQNKFDKRCRISAGLFPRNTRVTSQVWTCVRHVPKQSIA